MVEAGVSQFNRLRKSYLVHETLEDMPAILIFCRLVYIRVSG